MIDSRFVTYSEIEDFFKSGNILKIKQVLQNAVLISSIGDILYIVEQFQKNKLKIQVAELNSNFEIFKKDVFIPDIDRKDLLDNMFSGDEIVELWDKPCNPNISPRFSISLICIKTNISSFWTEKVFESMEDFYLNFESYA